MTDDTVRRHFEGQAKACDRLGSPFTARLCRLLAALLDMSTATGARVLAWRGDIHADAVSLRLCGGLHALVLAGRDEALAAAYPPNESDDATLGQAVADALRTHDATLLAALASPPQTNEIARSAMLLPGLLAVARAVGQPLALHEIGSSAGLNLNFDRYLCRYGERQWGDPASPVRLEPQLVGAPPPLDGELRIASRQGSDIAPVDIADPASRLRLRSYVWADQTARLARLDAALSLADRFPCAIARIDAAGFVRAKLATRRSGEAFVLFHSIMWQYMPEETRAAIAAALAEAGAACSVEAPVAWLRMEPLDTRQPHATLSLTLWPGGETRALARCDYHGRWIEWTQ